MENNNDKTIYVGENENEIQILLESYQLADNQLQMRIQQRDNFAIQLMAAIGVIIGVIAASDNILMAKLGILLIPIICSFFCSQILSSYEVHHRLAYYMKNVIEKSLEKKLNNNMILWENFCQYDRNVIKKTKIGGREAFFKKINIFVALISLLGNGLILFYFEQYFWIRRILVFEWYDYGSLLRL